MPESQDELYALLARTQDEEQAALGEFYDATVNRVYGFVLKLSNNRAITEEVIGDVYMQVWRQAADFDAERSSPIAWLLMIARSRTYDALRKEQSRTRLQDNLPESFDVADDVTPAPLDIAMESEHSADLKQAMNLLNAQQRQMIALAFYRDMSHSEIAHYIDLPLGTVKTTLRRSQAILRAAMTQPNQIMRDCYEQQA